MAPTYRFPLSFCSMLVSFYLPIYGPFNDAICRPDRIVSNDGMINELQVEGTSILGVVTSFEALTWH
jgi:hypothetical protein